MSAAFMKSAEIHARVGETWPAILAQLGVPASLLTGKHGPCPGCGGKDRFRFDNKYGRGDYICNRCGNGNGFDLLEHFYGWPYKVSRARVMDAAGLTGTDAAALHSVTRDTVVAPINMATPDAPALPPEHVLSLRRECCAIESCDETVDYLMSRHVWPLPPGCTLRAHSTVRYCDSGKTIGWYPALVADVLDIAGQLVTVHVTWLHQGKKLAGHQPRKLLSKMTRRVGCAARLMPATNVLGIAEGIETAISAALLQGVPVWAACSTSLLASFEPPPMVTTLRIYADRDEAGLASARKLMNRLQGRVRLELRVPPAPANDWNEVLINRNSRLNVRNAKFAIDQPSEQ
jgi:putative DNA primase/helicase